METDDRPSDKPPEKAEQDSLEACESKLASLEALLTARAWRFGNMLGPYRKQIIGLPSTRQVAGARGVGEAQAYALQGTPSQSTPSNSSMWPYHLWCPAPVQRRQTTKTRLSFALHNSLLTFASSILDA